MVIIDFALEKYPFIVATGVTLIVYFVVKRFADSLVTKMGAKSEFPKARTQLVKKYIDVLLAALLLLVLISIWGGKARPDIPLYLLYTHHSRGGLLCPMVYTEQCNGRNHPLLLFSFQNRRQNPCYGQGFSYRGRDQGHLLFLYAAQNRFRSANLHT